MKAVLLACVLLSSLSATAVAQEWIPVLRDVGALQWGSSPARRTSERESAAMGLRNSDRMKFAREAFDHDYAVTQCDVSSGLEKVDYDAFLSLAGELFPLHV